jgi:hypothetical protein
MRAGITTVGQLACLDKDSLHGIRGIGEGTVADILGRLERYAAACSIRSPVEKPREVLCNDSVSDSARLEVLSDGLVGDSAPLEVLGLTPGLQGSLVLRRIQTVGDLARMTESEFLAIGKLGPGCLERALDRLQAYHARALAEGPLSECRAPLSVLGLSTRCRNALARAGITSVGALANLSPEHLSDIRGVAVGTMQEVASRLAFWADLSDEERQRLWPETEQDRPSLSATRPTPEPDAVSTGDGHAARQGKRSPSAVPGPESFGEYVNDWLESLPDRSRQIVCARYGFDGRPQTLEEIAQCHGVTRERIRQIIAKAERSLAVADQRAHVQPYVDSASRLADQMGSLLSSDELRRELPRALPLGALDPCLAGQLLCAISPSLVWLRGEGALVLASAPYRRLRSLRAELRRILAASDVSIPASEVVARFVNAHLFDDERTIEDAFAIACLRTDPEVELKDGHVTLARGYSASRKERAIEALRVLGEPSSFDAILVEVNRGRREDERMARRNLAACLNWDRDAFVRVGRGVYGLAEWGLPDDGCVANAICRVLAEGGGTLTYDEIAKGVLSTWRVREGTIQAALSLDERIERIGRGLYTLRG